MVAAEKRVLRLEVLQVEVPPEGPQAPVLRKDLPSGMVLAFPSPLSPDVMLEPHSNLLHLPSTEALLPLPNYRHLEISMMSEMNN